MTTVVESAPVQTEPAGPRGSVGAVAVSSDTMMVQGDLVPAWRIKVQCLDGSGRIGKLRALRSTIVDGQEAVESWATTHGHGVQWSVTTLRLAVGFLVRGPRG